MRRVECPLSEAVFTNEAVLLYNHAWNLVKYGYRQLTMLVRRTLGKALVQAGIEDDVGRFTTGPLCPLARSLFCPFNRLGLHCLTYS